MSKRYTWKEAKESERKRLGREPTEAEVERLYNVMTSG